MYSTYATDRKTSHNLNYPGGVTRVGGGGFMQAQMQMQMQMHWLWLMIFNQMQPHRKS